MELNTRILACYGLGESYRLRTPHVYRTTPLSRYWKVKGDQQTVWEKARFRRSHSKQRNWRPNNKGLDIKTKSNFSFFDVNFRTFKMRHIEAL